MCRPKSSIPNNSDSIREGDGIRLIVDDANVT